jgi:hypothetical protein
MPAEHQPPAVAADSREIVARGLLCADQGREENRKNDRGKKAANPRGRKSASAEQAAGIGGAGGWVHGKACGLSRGRVAYPMRQQQVCR